MASPTASSLEAFQIQPTPSESKIKQLRLELAKHLKAQELQQSKERQQYLSPAAVRVRALQGVASKALDSVSIRFCQSDSCTPPRDMPNGNNYLTSCKRCIDNGLGSPYEALAVEIMTPSSGSPTDRLAVPPKRASKLTSKKRDSLELDIDIEEGKVEVLAKRRRKTSNLDLST
ncbi:hypothetical protein IFR05_017366, partial [Cadophora sp. M221]